MPRSLAASLPVNIRSGASAVSGCGDPTLPPMSGGFFISYISAAAREICAVPTNLLTRRVGGIPEAAASAPAASPRRFAKTFRAIPKCALHREGSKDNRTIAPERIDALRAAAGEGAGGAGRRAGRQAAAPGVVFGDAASAERNWQMVRGPICGSGRGISSKNIPRGSRSPPEAASVSGTEMPGGAASSRAPPYRRNYQFRKARSKTVRLPLAEVTWPKVLAVGDVLPKAKNGWFRKFRASTRNPIFSRS